MSKNSSVTLDDICLAKTSSEKEMLWRKCLEQNGVNLTEEEYKVFFEGDMLEVMK